jgi:hypothetical protein
VVIRSEARGLAISAKVTTCFVAGTPVHTKKGLVPIEKLRAGDLVLSRPEQGGETAYRAVVKAARCEANTIGFIEYTLDPFTKDEKSDYLVLTNDHPLWIKNEGWTAVDHIDEGSELELVDGRTAVVARNLRIFRADSSDPRANNWGWTGFDTQDPGYTIDLSNDSVAVYPEIARPLWGRGIGSDFKRTVYNVEVEGFHTYFVGELGIWVHATHCDAPRSDELAINRR